VAVVASGCSLRRPADTNANTNAAVNYGPVNSVDVGGRIYQSDEPIQPTTEEEYRAAVAGAWQAYLDAGGSTDFDLSGVTDVQAQIDAVGVLAEAVVPMTVPADMVDFHLDMVIAVTQWEAVLLQAADGTDADSLQETAEAARAHLDTALTAQSWLADVLQ